MTDVQANARRPARPGGSALPSAWRVSLISASMELRAFFREREAVVFVFSMPAILLILLGSIFKNTVMPEHLKAGQLFAAGLIGGGIAATTFQNLGVSIAIERDHGTLRQLSGTPMPRVAYFLGKTGLVTVCVVAETVLMMIVAAIVDHLRLPWSAERWWTFVWVLVLGSVACSLLGIAISSLPHSARSASAVIAMPLVALQFISGVYLPFTFVPPWLADIASFFPLKWICQGLRSALLPSRAVLLEPGHNWEHGRTALILGLWAVAGLVLCLTTFRWRSRRDG
jgi:ABC-2 type transport system permease protein